MFVEKVFNLYNYQKEIQEIGRNSDFSKVINREYGGSTVSALDDLFYQISSDRCVDANSLQSYVKASKNDPGISSLKENIDGMIFIADIITHKHRG